MSKASNENKRPTDSEAGSKKGKGSGDEGKS